MKKSIGGIHNNIVVCILILITIASSSLGIAFSVLALILEVDDNLVRYYAKHMIICGIITLFITTILNGLRIDNIVINTLLLLPILILELISLYKGYNSKIWEMPLISKFIRKIKF